MPQAKRTAPRVATIARESIKDVALSLDCDAITCGAGVSPATQFVILSAAKIAVGSFHRASFMRQDDELG